MVCAAFWRFLQDGNWLSKLFEPWNLACESLTRFSLWSLHHVHTMIVPCSLWGELFLMCQVPKEWNSRGYGLCVLCHPVPSWTWNFTRQVSHHTKQNMRCRSLGNMRQDIKDCSWGSGACSEHRGWSHTCRMLNHFSIIQANKLLNKMYSNYFQKNTNSKT